MTLLDLLRGLHFDVGKVEIHTDQAVAVIDEDGVALVEQIFGDHHCPVGHRQDRRAYWRGVVTASVGLRGWLAVEDSLHAKRFAFWQRSGRRPERQGELGG